MRESSALAGEFLDKYRQLESLVKAKYPDAASRPIPWLIDNRITSRSLQVKLDLCRNARNILSHNPTIDGEYPVYPSPGLIKALDQAIALLDERHCALEICTKRHELACGSLDDRVKPVINQMRDKMFSFVPILDDGVLLGVFSDNALLRCIADEEIIEVDDNVVFADMSEYLSLGNHPEGTFGFIPKCTPLCEIELQFSDSSPDGERLGLLFVTEHGKRDERIIGIITLWDVVKRSQTL